MKLSAALCVYNKDRVDYFEEAYESILAQSLLPDQIVLVVDGPIGKDLSISIDIFKSMALAKNIEFDDIWLSENKGHGIARGKSILACKYDLVAIVDADDINEVERFKKQKSYMEENIFVSLVGSQILEVDHESLAPISKKLVPQSHNEIVHYIKYRCPFNQMSVMFKRQDVLLVGNYIDFYHNEDYYLWLRLLVKGYRFHNLEEFLVKARINTTFYSRRGGVKYFLSELKLQKFMLKEKLINTPVFIFNVSIRFLVQVLLPTSLRSKIFSIFFRRGVK